MHAVVPKEAAESDAVAVQVAVQVAACIVVLRNITVGSAAKHAPSEEEATALLPTSSHASKGNVPTA